MSERREVPRYLYGGPANVSEPAALRVSTITIISLSVNGFRAKGSSIPDVGKTCELLYEWEGKQFRGQVEVMWKQPDGVSGLKLVSCDDQSREVLRRLCASLQLEPLTKRPMPPKE